MIKLRYGNTNTYYLAGLLIDTDMPGTIGGLFKELKKHGIELKDIQYVLATHYHPDHMGLISELMNQGVKLLLLETQKEFVHFSDSIFKKDKLAYTAINETTAKVIPCKDSRSFLSSIGICGEIISIPSHSRDSIALISDDGNCFVGDLEPMDYSEAYEDNEMLKKDWEHILSFNPKTVFYAHRPETILY